MEIRIQVLYYIGNTNSGVILEIRIQVLSKLYWQYEFQVLYWKYEFKYYNNLYDTHIWDAGPLGFGTNMTVNTNGDSTDTYMNINERPLFVPSDSTIFYSWNLVDSILTFLFTPPDYWNDYYDNDSIIEVTLTIRSSNTTNGSYIYHHEDLQNQLGDYWTGSFNLYDIGFYPYRFYFDAFNANNDNYFLWGRDTDFFSEPYHVDYMAYTDTVDANSPTIDAGNPATTAPSKSKPTKIICLYSNIMSKSVNTVTVIVMYTSISDVPIT